MIRATRLTTILIAIAILPAAAWGQKTAVAAGGGEAETLAKKLSNPISDLVSVPLQFNWAQPVGPEDDTRFILNVQPVVPLSISENWNLVSRVILPFVGQPSLAPGTPAASGLGDVLASFFVSPKAGKVVWGVGPAISLPSTSEPTLGTGKWSAGPSAVALRQQGRWTYGALVNQLWSFAGNDNRADVSQMFVQPFLSYTMPNAVTYSINSESIANWEAPSENRWTVPINLAVAKLATFGPLPASYQVGAGVYVESPEGGPDWQLRATVVVLLPRKR